MVCPCCVSNQCCCAGTSLITLEGDEVTPTGEECLEIQEQPCEGDPLSRPSPAESCTGATVVIEWCDLTVTLECGVTTGNVQDANIAENFPAPPYLCNADGVDINRQVLIAGFSSDLNNQFTNRSSCSFGCLETCDSCAIYFAFVVFETPNTGFERNRYYYGTQRKGCDESPILEQVSDEGAYCCPETPEVTVTFAP